jgi:hypothetical protein
MDTKGYEKPQVNDYGDLLELTAAQGFVNAEDGGSKLLIHHLDPINPSQPF